MSGQADIGIRVFLDDAASKGLFAINSQLGMIAGLAQRATTGFDTITNSMMAMSAVAGFALSFVAFGIAIKASVDAASQFQQAMFSVAVATHVPMDVALQYSSTLMNLAADSTYTSAEIAAGIATLGRSGYSIGDIFKYMAQAGVALGEATRSSAADGFRILAQTMTAYNLPATQAMHIADLLQFAFEHQTGTIAQFSSALSQVTPAAAQFHIPLEEIVAALDTVGPAMTTVATAGTGVRYMVSSLYSPTKIAQTAMLDLGLATGTAGGVYHSVFYDAHGRAIDFTSALEILFGKLGGLSEEARNNALHELFSVRGGQGADVLYQEIGKYLGYIKQLNDTSDNAGGAMKRWQEVMGTLAGATAGLKTSFNDLGVVIGNAILPFVTQVVTGLNGFVTMIRSVALANSSVIPSFLIVGTALSAFGLIAGIVILAMNGIGLAFLVMAGIVLGVVASTVALSAGIIAVVGFFQNAHGAANTFMSVLRAVGLAVLFVGAAFAGFQGAQMLAVFVQMVPLLIQLAGEYVMLAVDMGIAALASIREFIATTALIIVLAAGMIPTLIAAAGAWIIEAAAMMIAAAPFILIGVLIAGAVIGFVLLIQHLGGLNMILNLGRAIWASLLPVFAQAAATIRGQFAQAVQQLQPVWQQLMAALRQAAPMLMVLGAVIGGVIAVAMAIWIGTLRGLINVFVAVLVMVIHVAAGIIQAFAGIVQFFMGFFTVLHGIFTGNFSEIQAGFRTMGAGIMNIITGLWNAVKAVFIGAFQIIVGFVSGFIQGVIGFFHMLSSVLVGHSIIPDMLAAILSVFTSGFNAVRSLVMSVIDFIVSAFRVWASMVQAVIQLVMNVIRTLFTQGFAAALAVATSGIASIIARFASMPGPIGGFIRGVIAVVTTIIGAINGVAASIGGAIGRIVGAFQSMASGIGGAINSALGFIGSLANAAAGVGGTLHNLHVPGFATGAIVTSPTLAVVGEGNEPEIILPWSKYQAAMQGAANMNAAGGGNTGTTVNNFIIDGRVVAKSVMNNLTGQLQLNGMGRAMGGL